MECSLTGKPQPLENFSKHSTCTDKVNSQCKSCVNKRSRQVWWTKHHPNQPEKPKARIGFKFCSKRSRCIYGQVEQPIGHFYPSNKTKDGRQSTCISCDHRAREQWYNKTHQRRSIARVGFKFCGKCTLELPLEEFNKDKSTTTHLSSFCRSCQQSSDTQVLRKNYQIRSLPLSTDLLLTETEHTDAI